MKMLITGLVFILVGRLAIRMFGGPTVVKHTSPTFWIIHHRGGCRHFA